jgi:hypothetical protein
MNTNRPTFWNHAPAPATRLGGVGRVHDDDLRRVASALEELTDEPLPHNLTASVLAKLPKPKNHFIRKLVSAAQAGISIGMVILFFSNLLAWLQPQNYLTVVFSQSVGIKFSIPQLSFTVPQFPVFHVQLSSIVFLAIATLAL